LNRTELKIGAIFVLLGVLLMIIGLAWNLFALRYAGGLVGLAASDFVASMYLFFVGVIVSMTGVFISFWGIASERPAVQWVRPVPPSAGTEEDEDDLS
jgi:ABC-type long-subunit fatty acid transport system fused permease/ATPase subunit